MFEKEANLHASIMAWDEDVDTWETIAERSFQQGAEFGYNKGYHDAEEHYMNVIDSQHKLVEKSKANEWHYVKDGDLPKVDNRIVLCICGNGYIEGKYRLKLLTRKEFPLFQPVYAWKEIVLPKGE